MTTSRPGSRSGAGPPGHTGAQLYEYMVGLAEQGGWQFGGTIAGHLVGQFPHDKISGDEIEHHIMPGSDQPTRRTDRAGLTCHWILEVHLVDRDRQIGGSTRSCSTSGP